MDVDKAKVEAARAIAKARREAGKALAKEKGRLIREKEKLAAGLEDEDPKRLTRWIHDGERDASCHAGGASMRGGDWLLAECAALKAKGKKVGVRRHASMAGHAALFLE